MTTTAPAPQPPPTGWLHTAIHAFVGALGALLAGLAAFNQVTGTVPRTTAITVGALVSLGALISWATGHTKVLDALASNPAFSAALTVSQDVMNLMPNRLKGRLETVEQTATQALQLAQSAQAPQPVNVQAVVDQVMAQVQARLSGPVAVAPPPPPPAA